MNPISAPITFVTALFIFSAYMTSGSYGLKCYLCSSDTDKRCADPFNASSTDLSIPIRQDDCGPTYYAGMSSSKFVCRKIKQRLSNNDIKVSRMCVTDGEKESDPCSPNALSTFLKVEHCSTCNTELCNGAISAFQISAAFLAPAVILATKLNII